MGRCVLVVGNWKLNGNKDTIIDFFGTLIDKCRSTNNCSVVIAPPLTYLGLVSYYLIESNIKLCAQNVDINLSGAFTGDISAIMLKDIGVQYVIVGHSERRIFHREDDIYIAKKFAIVKKVGLIPVLCIGENKKEYDAKNTLSICIKQIDAVINLLGVQSLKDSVIAYEPIWAIGSGCSAIPEEIQNIHSSIREYIATYDTLIAERILIQYGGSVTEKNVTQFLMQKDIDGVLVGSASLKVESFCAIVSAVDNISK